MGREIRQRTIADPGRTLEYLMRQFPELSREELEQALRGDHLRLPPQAQPAVRDRDGHTETAGTRRRAPGRSVPDLACRA